jgi:hypothetical protein
MEANPQSSSEETGEIVQENILQRSWSTQAEHLLTRLIP